MLVTRPKDMLGLRVSLFLDQVTSGERDNPAKLKRGDMLGIFYDVLCYVPAGFSRVAYLSDVHDIGTGQLAPLLGEPSLWHVRTSSDDVPVWVPTFVHFEKYGGFDWSMVLPN